MSEVDATEGAEITQEISEPAPEKFKMAPAPALRVEQIKEGDTPATSPNVSACTSEEEGPRDKHVVGEGSDIDGATGAEKEFVPPDDELKDRIIKQVEFYFSDANILKDAFLLKHVRRNKQGYVSLKLITSFKKVKSLTKDYRVVAFSLRQSDHLEVNEEGMKVRRTEPLPDYDETTPSRTVVAVNLPVTQPTIENIAEMFSNCGDIALVRIIRPGKNVPPDIKRHSNKHPEIGVTVCAVVEFEQHEAAKKAVATLTNKEDWRGGLRVVLLAMPKPKKENNKNSEKKNDKIEKDVGAISGGSDDGRGDEKKRRKRGGRKKKNARVDELCNTGEQSAESGGSGSEQDHTPRNQRSSLSPGTYDPNRLSPNTTPRSSPRNSPKSSPTSRRRNVKKSPLVEGSPGTSPKPSPKPSPKSSPEMWRKKYDSGGDGSPSSPWVQRRMKHAAAQQTSPLAVEGSPMSSPLLNRKNTQAPSCVIRHPRGPDGTKGFVGGAGRGKPVAAAE